jgi:Spy/CpxP family protein refolding chaperone
MELPRTDPLEENLARFTQDSQVFFRQPTNILTMKHFISAMLAVAICLVPLGAFAGEPSAPEMVAMHGMGADMQLTPQQHQAIGQIMTRTHQQLEQLHSQARARILGSLSPAHRAALAQIIGNLAISANPDRAAAVRQIDAALTPTEARAVMTTHDALKQQKRAIMESAHKQCMALLTPQQRASMQRSEAKEAGESKADMHGATGAHENSMESEDVDTAGSILLELSSGSESHGSMEMQHE